MEDAVTLLIELLEATNDYLEREVTEVDILHGDIPTEEDVAKSQRYYAAIDKAEKFLREK